MVKKVQINKKQGSKAYSGNRFLLEEKFYKGFKNFNRKCG